VHRDPLRAIVLRGLVATVLLPVVIAAALGLRALLDSLGDAEGAVLCGRLGIVAALMWVAALAGTVAGTAVAVLGPPPGPPRRRRRRGPPPGDQRFGERGGPAKGPPARSEA